MQIIGSFFIVTSLVVTYCFVVVYLLLQLSFHPFYNHNGWQREDLLPTTARRLLCRGRAIVKGGYAAAPEVDEAHRGGDHQVSYCDPKPSDGSDPGGMASGTSGGTGGSGVLDGSRAQRLDTDADPSDPIRTGRRRSGTEGVVGCVSRGYQCMVGPCDGDAGLPARVRTGTTGRADPEVRTGGTIGGVEDIEPECIVCGPRMVCGAASILSVYDTRM